MSRIIHIFELVKLSFTIRKGILLLLAWMKERPADASCQDDCAALLETLSEFRGKARQNDDIAIMSIRLQ